MHNTIMNPAIGAGGNSQSNSQLVAEYRKTLRQLKEKEVTVVDELASCAAERRPNVRYKLAQLREMIRDTRDTIRRLSPPQGRRHGFRQWSFDGCPWGSLDYLSWQQLESMECNNKEELEWMRAVVDDGSGRLSKRQRQVLTMRYQQGLRNRAIAAELGVDPSTVGKTLHRAVDNLKRYADARTLVAKCMGEGGRLDVVQMVRATHVLTERQREEILMTLSGMSQTAIASRLSLDKSTVSRTVKRSAEKLRRLIDAAGATSPTSWEATCEYLAEEYGLSLGAVYKAVGGSERGRDGLTLLQREIQMRIAKNMTPCEVAGALGINIQTVYRLTNKKSGKKEI